MGLPNISLTWAKLGIKVEPFKDWLVRQEAEYASDSVQKLSYLSELLMKRTSQVTLDPSGETCCFARELRLAIDQMVVTRNTEYADKIIRGERLHVDLHSDYVDLTKCYGEDS